MDLNFALKPNSKAVDAGVMIPTINEDFVGRAPDLGALETGQPRPHHGFPLAHLAAFLPLKPLGTMHGDQMFERDRTGLELLLILPPVRGAPVQNVASAGSRLARRSLTSLH